MQLIDKKTQVKKSLALLTVGALALTPFLNPISVQAAPPDNAPARGYRKDKNDRDNRDGRGNRDRDTRNITVQGRVTRDLSGDQFTLRADDGRTYRVISRDEPRRLSDGDRVEVRGWIEGGNFIAERVQVLNNRDWEDRGQNTTISGRVTTDFQGESFQMIGDNGRTYIVVSRNEPNRLSRGDTVRVQGRLDRDGRTIFANSINITNDNGNNGNPGQNNGQFISLGGRVTSDLRGEVFQIAADNGRTYTVVARNEPLRLSRGDIVRLHGRLDRDGKTLYATSVNITRDTGGNGGQQNVDFQGTVVRIQSRNRLDVRGDNGVTYVVSSGNNVPNGISVRDRVRIAGVALNRTEVRATHVQLISDQSPQGSWVNIIGYIENVTYNNGFVTMRLRSDSQIYSVRYRSTERFRIGERVRVAGSLHNGTVDATSVQR